MFLRNTYGSEEHYLKSSKSLSEIFIKKKPS